MKDKRYSLFIGLVLILATSVVACNQPSTKTPSAPPQQAISPIPAATPAPITASPQETTTVPSPSPEIVTHKLITTVDPEGGSISPSGGQYKAGSQITITASPSIAIGYTFDYWSGDASGRNPTVTITMDSDKTVVAHFLKIDFKAKVELIMLSPYVESDPRNPSGGLHKTYPYTLTNHNDFSVAVHIKTKQVNSQGVTVSSGYPIVGGDILPGETYYNEIYIDPDITLTFEVMSLILTGAATDSSKLGTASHQVSIASTQFIDIKDFTILEITPTSINRREESGSFIIKNISTVAKTFYLQIRAYDTQGRLFGVGYYDPDVNLDPSESRLFKGMDLSLRDSFYPGYYTDPPKLNIVYRVVKSWAIH